MVASSAERTEASSRSNGYSTSRKIGASCMPLAFKSAAACSVSPPSFHRELRQGGGERWRTHARPRRRSRATVGNRARWFVIAEGDLLLEFLAVDEGHAPSRESPGRKDWQTSGVRAVQNPAGVASERSIPEMIHLYSR